MRKTFHIAIVVQAYNSWTAEQVKWEMERTLKDYGTSNITIKHLDVVQEDEADTVIEGVDNGPLVEDDDTPLKLDGPMRTIPLREADRHPDDLAANPPLTNAQREQQLRDQRSQR